MKSFDSNIAISGNFVLNVKNLIVKVTKYIADPLIFEQLEKKQLAHVIMFKSKSILTRKERTFPVIPIGIKIEK